MSMLGVISNRVTPRKLENLESIIDLADPVDPELLAVFEEEATAGLLQIEEVLAHWDMTNTVDPLRRLRFSFHALKGAANSIGHVRIGALADGMEELLVEFNPAYAFVLRDSIIKTCILTLEAVKALIKEARDPKFSPAKKECLLAAIHSIMNLKSHGADLRGVA